MIKLTLIIQQKQPEKAGNTRMQLVAEQEESARTEPEIAMANALLASITKFSQEFMTERSAKATLFRRDIK